MRVVYLGRDLMMGSRIAAAADAGQAELRRADAPSELPPPGEVDLVLVDWNERRPDWGDALRAWCVLSPQSTIPRIVLFGPHTDLEAHRAARAAGLTPMWARSKVISVLSELIST